MPQKRLDSLWGAPTAKISSSWDLTVEDASKTAAAKVKAEAKDIATASEDGQPFVQNGSRDRFGHPRSKVGGRPKKIVDSDMPTPHSPKKKIGQTQVLRREYPATEKMAMIMEYRRLEGDCTKKFSGDTEEHRKLRQEMLAQLVKSAIPALQNKDFLEKLLKDEDYWRQLILDRQLGKDVQNPARQSRGVHTRGGGSSHGHDPGVGFRKRGAGRPNKALHLWKIVKSWHTVERLSGLQVDEEDVWHKF